MLRNGHVRFGGRVGETDRRQRRHRAPARPSVSGLPRPRALRLPAAYRPNSISRVFSAFSSRVNFASLPRRSAQNRSASSRYSNPTTKSSAKRTITTSPRACRRPPLVGPQVEDVVQIDVRKQR